MGDRHLESYVVGEHVRSTGRSITTADITGWAALMSDWTELHVNEYLMAQSRFGAPIAHGYIAFNLSVGLMFPSYASWYWPASAVRHEGWVEVQFTAPVQVGDTLWCERTIIEVVADRDDSGVVVHDVRLVNQREEVVFTGTERVRIGRLQS